MLRAPADVDELEYLCRLKFIVKDRSRTHSMHTLPFFCIHLKFSAQRNSASSTKGATRSRARAQIFGAHTIGAIVLAAFCGENRAACAVTRAHPAHTQRVTCLFFGMRFLHMFFEPRELCAGTEAQLKEGAHCQGLILQNKRKTKDASKFDRLLRQILVIGVHALWLLPCVCWKPHCSVMEPCSLAMECCPHRRSTAANAHQLGIADAHRHIHIYIHI